jgi:NTE family protein
LLKKSSPRGLFCFKGKMSPPSAPKIGLALGGGMVRALAHLGVLETLEKAGVPIGAISGTSGGSLVGAFYATGKYPVDRLIELVLSLGWRDWIRPSWSPEGLMDSRRIGQFVTERLGPIAFQDLAISFAAVACDLTTGSKVVLSDGPLAPAIQASCSLPVLFTPTVLNGQRLVDGGYVSQIPVLAAQEVLKGERVIGVDVNFRASETARPPRHLLGIAIHMASLWARKNADEESRRADIMIRVDARGIGLTDFRKTRELIERGRRAAQESLPAISQWLAV